MRKMQTARARQSVLRQNEGVRSKRVGRGSSGEPKTSEWRFVVKAEQVDSDSDCFKAFNCCGGTAGG